MGGVSDVITCAKFQVEIFMGYDFTGDRIFDFPTTVQRYCSACDSPMDEKNCYKFYIRLTVILDIIHYILSPANVHTFHIKKFIAFFSSVGLSYCTRVVP